MALELPIYQVDAFADALFGGNPAAVVPLRDWLADRLLEQIADENNPAETAFFVPDGDTFALRWFTPTVEVPLCGHATLASAYVLLRELGAPMDGVAFDTRSGALRVRLRCDALEMDFPADPPRRVEPPDGLAAVIG